MNKGTETIDKMLQMLDSAEREISGSVSDYEIWRCLADDLPEEELEALNAREREDAELRRRIAEKRTQSEQILALHPPAEMAAKYMAHRASLTRRGFWKKLARRIRDKYRSWDSLDLKRFSRRAVPALVCAAALLYLPARVFMPAVHTAAFDAGAEVRGDRVKSAAPSLDVWRKVDNGAEPLAPGAAVRNGDIVQVRYVVPEPCYGAIVSLDGRGVLTVHFTGESGKAARLTPSPPADIGNAYRLDDAPRFETFYFITADKNFDVNTVAESLKNGGDLRGGGLRVTEFMLRKI